MKNEIGFVLYQGPSVLDGAPIAVVATMKTKNAKTGNMVQTWIIRTDIAPHEATKTGNDVSVCGNCVHRPANQGSCYVTVFQAPLQVYKAFHAGKYSSDVSLFYSLLANRFVRMGAYGDPSAAPFEIWEGIAQHAAGHTGYVHQMEHQNFDKRMLSLCMASADTEKQAVRYQKEGIRYFRVLSETGKKIQGEVECLADSAGKTCLECRVCDGSGRGKGKSIYIKAHGAKASNFNPDIIAAA